MRPIDGILLTVVLAAVLICLAANQAHDAACVAGAQRGPYAGRLSKADEAQLIKDCQEGRKFH